MATEIELKYLVLGDTAPKTITELLGRNNIHFDFQQNQLSNCYFDTADLNLRQHDIGLRVRTVGSHIEQTIKTAGQVVGGLHQRPEYNVTIDSHFPTLALFPQVIWHQEQCVDDLQQQLIPLFSTDFTRCTWLITDSNENVIELAFDQGNVISEGQEELINELELELVAGQPAALFELANLLFLELALRPGIKSKAARGYALWRAGMINGHDEKSIFVCDNNVTSIEQAFTQGIGNGLTELQVNIDRYLSAPQLLSLVNVKESLAILRHGFWLFEDYLDPDVKLIREELSHFIHLFSWVDNALYLQELTTKTGNYRKKLDYSKQLIEQLKIEKRRFPTPQDIIELMHSARFNQLQLALLKLFLARENTKFTTKEGSSQQLFSFARDKIDESLVEITLKMKASPHLTCEQYIGQSKQLYRSLLTGTWLAGLFEQDARDKFRHPWLDLQQGISELQALWIIQQQLLKLNHPPERLSVWQKGKLDGLLAALDRTKEMAMAMPPYWRV